MSMLPPDLEDRSAEDLHELAREKDIPGRSKMDKPALIRALRAQEDTAARAEATATPQALSPDLEALRTSIANFKSAMSDLSARLSVVEASLFDGQ